MVSLGKSECCGLIRTLRSTRATTDGTMSKCSTPANFAQSGASYSNGTQGKLIRLSRIHAQGRARVRGYLAPLFKNPAGPRPPGGYCDARSGTRHLDPHHVLEDSFQTAEDRELVDLLGHLLQGFQLLQTEQRRILIHQPRGV